MNNRLWQFLKPEILQDDEIADMRAILSSISLTALLISALLLIISALNSLSIITAMTGMALLSSLVILRMISQGWLTAPRCLFPLFTFLYATYLSVIYDGIRDEAILLYPLTLALAGLLLGKRGIIAFALLSTTAILVIGSAQMRGMLQAHFDGSVSFSTVIIVEALILFTAVLLYLTNSHLRDSLERSRRFSRQVEKELAYRKQVEAELQESREHFRSMFERHSAIMLLVNPETGRIITANQAAVNYYGYSAETFQGMLITQINPLPFEDIHAAMQTATHVQQNYFQFQHHLADGTVREVEVYSTPIPFQGQQILFSIIHDITERKRIEEALLQAKEAAEFANLAKTNFLRSVSHELRTPLNHILGFARILEGQISDALNPRQAKQIAAILASSDHLLKLIEDILMLSQLDFEKTDLYLSQIPLKRLLENSVRTIREKDLKHALTLTIKLPPELETATIKADQRKLMQILFQLLANAVKFTSDGGAILLDAERNGADIVISVTDTGIGIAPEDQEHIFAPFYQVRSGLANKTPGTGLGLSIARRLVELHGGKLWVSSAGTGAGSRFSFSVPQGAVSQTDDAFQRFDTPLIVFQAAEELSATSAEVEIEIVPPRPNLEAIYELVILGKVFEIQAYVERLETQDARYQPFARKVWALAQAFEDQQIAALVKMYLEQS